MTAQTYVITPVDGIGVNQIGKDSAGNPTSAGTVPGTKRMHFGQNSNSHSSQTVNQSVGVAGLPAINAGVTGTVTVLTTLISAASIFTALNARNSNGDATAGRGVVLAVAAIIAGTSFVIEYTPLVNMAQAWEAHWEFVN